ncbi:hypothetical protein DRP53_07270 [candidate division WOR-3 bacterium]|uniref:FAD/NAD(P)-binding domain-containing protein n=1 Tax=candidate division WOR-3 bacterium TaxID=2052148 RepID=A0A660SGH7_UNCW3|nr:MAG: hypothetical protein DRP53_07270 [candidate division WOR-3 bacterium]
MSDGKNKISTIISVFLVGGGQIYSGRIWAGIAFALTFYGTIALIKIIWTGFNFGFYPLLVVWIIIWLYNILDAYKGYCYEPPPCERNCPAGIRPWIYLNYLAQDKPAPLSYIPFFEILGMVCPAPCEDHCTRRAYDDPVAIKHLKLGVKKVWIRPKARKSNASVGIVGAGPCGLSLAASLKLRGYQVTVMEREGYPGGMPAIAIPEFRLPTSVLKKEVDEILSLGIELRTGVEVGRDISIDELLDRFDLITIAVGAMKPLRLDIPGEERVCYGIDILRRAKKGERFEFGRVGVIGGGNTAIDVARTLVRFGNEVKIYYRRRAEDMPAEPEDREEAVEEGIEIIPLVLPIGIEGKRHHFIRTRIVDGRPEIVENSEFEVELDQLVIAIGQEPDIDFLKDKLLTDQRGFIVVKNGRSSHPKIYAGGDVVAGPKTIAHAVGHGLRIAQRIDQNLRKIPGFFAWLGKREYPFELKLLPFTERRRMMIPHRNSESRIKDFEPVELIPSPDEMKREAERCLVCPLRYRP